MDPLLRVEGVRKAFGSLIAVHDVSFTVSEGEIFGIAGPNGAGKSTLFNLISGIPYGPDRGQITFAGRRISGQSPRRIVRLGIARTFQREVAFGALTVRENVEVAHAFGARAGSSRPAAADEWLEYFDLRGDAERLAADLPLFAKKRLMLASGMALTPRLLLLDEPASGLTAPEVTALDELIRRLNKTGVGVILIEHVLPLLMAVSARVLIMDHGSVIFEGPPDDVVRDVAVVEAYLGERGKELIDAT